MSANDSDSRLDLVVIGAVIGGISFVFFIVVLCFCRRLIRRTSTEGRKQAMLKAQLQRRPRVEKEADDDNEDDGNLDEPLVMPLKRADDDDDDFVFATDGDVNLERFSADPVELARNGLYLPKAAANREPCKSLGADFRHVAVPARRVALWDAPEFERPKVIWNEETDSFGFASPVADQQTAKPQAESAAARDEGRQPVGRFLGLSPTFQPHRPLSLSPSRNSRWQ
jgi:hypothetical protein